MSLVGGLRRLYRGESTIDFIGKRKLWFAISGLILLISLGSLIFRGFNYGIEFAGGVSIQAPVEAGGPAADLSDTELIAEVRERLRPFDAQAAQVQVASTEGQRNVIVQTKEINDPEQQQQVRSAVSDAVGASTADTTFESVGRKWGEEITAKAVRALIIFLIVILVFLTWRFEWKMGLAALVALVHDLMITAGLYSLAGFEVSPSTVIAILTILGYSLYDTVVVFDKVDEDTSRLAGTGKATYQDAANVSMNRVFARSLNTSLTTLIPVAALLFVGAGLAGAETLKDLALALFIGILGGTYSSIFIATPILSIMKEREPRYRNVREKVLQKARAQSKAEAALVGATSAGGAEAGDLATGPAARPVSSGAPAARPRAGAKKAKRRKKR
jgi:preprotein translocase subunit SecF